MFLKKIKLFNFRTYENLELEFENNINVFYGNNAEGKTNIIEAIYLSSITKSYRTSKDTECILFGNKYLKIEANFVSDLKINKEVSVYLDNLSQKQIREDNIVVKRYSDFIGKIPIVIFSPDNLNIVKGSPKERRNFLDILISQISKKYMINLQEYNKLIRIKNNLLKLEKERIDINYLDVLDDKIAEKIYYLSTVRSEYVNILENFAVNIQKELSKGKENLKIIYESDFINKNKNEILQILKSTRDSDIFRKTSTKGIGHDDLQILVNGKEVAKFGSQGQKRTSLLSLKIAEFKILKEKKEEIPIILLDDVFSELDENRINYLLDYIKDYQVFITTTEVDSIRDIREKNIFEVKKGIVEKK